MERTKSAISFGEDSMSYSLDSKTGSVRVHSRRKSQMLKVQRRMENLPQRKLLFRPKVYDWWTEGDELNEEENQRLLRDIAEKERKLLAKRKAAENEEDVIGSDDEDEMVKKLEQLKSRKQRERDYRAKLEDMKRQRDEEELAELEEKIRSELQNPSVYGWFFTDGYYDNAPFFGVRQDLVETLAAEQQLWIEKWGKKYPETFTEKFRRFFWPPAYVCKKKSMRTRGSYLDFPEVIADWPKAVDVNFEREPREYISNRHELFGIDEDQKEQDELAEAQAKFEAELAEKQELERIQREKEAEEAAKKQKALESGKSAEEPAPIKRKYDRPWVVKAPMRNPDSTKAGERKKSLDKASSGKGGFKWSDKSSSNKVKPSSDDIKLKQKQLAERRRKWIKKF